MSRGRIVYGAIALLLYVGCSSYVPQRAVIDTGTRHLGDGGWRVPEPEGEEISYTFELGRLGNEGKYPFRIGFLFRTELAFAYYPIISFTINGDTFPWDWDCLPPADTVKDDFLRIWEELVDEDDAYFSDLEKMIDEEGFYPGVWPGYIEEGTLEKGTNTITFIASEYSFSEDSLTDYMIGSIVISNEEIMDEYPRYYFFYR
ncbi:hypothetical protein KAX06_07370 [candidate division WOR-3 bacterium]|nr:hypothetical protein [candidate division WOR-3 bacterium]